MGMEFWLIPVLAMLIAGVAIFYMVIRHQGGSGARSDGQTFVDKPANEPDRQKAGWNHYK
jgi:hypothetical protein